MDGYLKIKTKIDNENIDKGIKELENKIKKMQSDNNTASTEQSGLENEIKNYEELALKAEEYRQKLKKLEKDKTNMYAYNPNLAVSTTPDLTKLNEQINLTKNKYSEITSEIDKQAPKIDKVYAKLDKVKAKQVENNSKIEEFKNNIEEIKVKNIETGVDSVGNSIKSTIKKIGKMTLAVFGIRTAFYAVRSAVSTISQYNPQISADIDYIKYALSNTILPVVQKLISFVYTLLSYINAISMAWFGINLFANSSAKAFKSSAKSAKEMNKSLQGFDEMNIQQDNSNSGVESGGVTPSVDLSGIQGETPIWLQWIIDNGPMVLSILAGIAGAIIALKLSDLLVSIKAIKEGIKLIQALGIGIAITGIILLIQDVIKFIQDPSWDGWLNILRDIAIVIAGLALAIGAWPALIIAVIALIVVEVVKHWDQIKSVLGAVGQWIYNNVIKPVGNFFAGLWNTIKSIFAGVGDFFKNIFTNAYNAIKNVFSKIGSFFSGIWNTIRNIFSDIGQKIGEAVSNTFKSAVNAVLSTIENVLNTPIRAINGLIGVINLVPGINLGRLSTFNLPRLAKGGVISQPTQAILGEAGKEAVMPLENNTEWIDLLADKLASKIGNNNSPYIIQMDSRTIKRGIAKQTKNYVFETNGGI